MKESVLLLAAAIAACSSRAGPACEKGTRETNCTILTVEDVTGTCAGYSEITGMLHVAGTLATDLDGLECLERVGGAVNIQDNALLADVDGLRSLVTVGGAMNIDGNDALFDLDGFSSLRTVGGYLQIMDDPALSHIDGLSGLTAIGGDLLILSHDELADISGLSSLETLSGANLIITQNPRLPTCQAQALADRLQAAGYAGTVIIAHNDDAAVCD